MPCFETRAPRVSVQASPQVAQEPSAWWFALASSVTTPGQPGVPHPHLMYKVFLSARGSDHGGGRG
jgi:hypothetical protein